MGETRSLLEGSQVIPGHPGSEVTCQNLRAFQHMRQSDAHRSSGTPSVQGGRMTWLACVIGVGPFSEGQDRAAWWLRSSGC